MLHSVRSLFSRSGETKRRPGKSLKNIRFNLETLEDRTAPAIAIAYVNQAWSGWETGSSIADADPTIPGDQPASLGVNAFAGLDAAAGAVQTGGTVTLWPGAYSNNVAMTNPFYLNVLPGNATISGAISGAPPLQIGKAGLIGDGTLTLSGVNTYTGGTVVARGRLRIGNDNQLGGRRDLELYGGGFHYLAVTAPGSVEVTNTMTTSRTIFLNNATLQVDSGAILGLSGAEINGGFLAGPGTIETIDQSPTSFNGVQSTRSLILNAKTNATFRNFENRGSIDFAVAKTFTLNSVTNAVFGTMLVNGTVHVLDFVTNGQIAVAPTGKLVNVGTSALTFGGSSNTTVHRLGPVDNIDDGFIDLGPVSAMMFGALMVNHGIVGSVTPGVNLVVHYGSYATGTGYYSSVLTRDRGLFSPGGSRNNEAVIGGVTSGRVQQNTTLIAIGSLTVTDPDPGEANFQPADVLTAYGSYTLGRDGNWIYTLNNNNPAVQALAHGDTLTDSFMAASLDGTRKPVMITITDASAAPIIPTVISGDASGSVQIDGALTVTGTLVVTDPDPGESTFQAVNSLTPYGSFTLTPDGEWVYTLDNNRPGLLLALTHVYSLTEGLTVRSVDGTATFVNITIHGVNDAPIFTQSNYNMTFEAAAAAQLIGSVRANNTDPKEQFQIVTYAITAGNAAGAFSIDASTGAITYNGEDCCGSANLDLDFELIVSATDNGDPIKAWSTATVSVKRRSSV